MSRDPMRQFISVKSIMAKPMTLGDYNTVRGWTIPANEDPNREGYFVLYPDGYQSWSPKEAFESSSLMIGDENRSAFPMGSIVASMVSHTYGVNMGSKTRVQFSMLTTGHEVTASVSCQNPHRFDEMIGTDLANTKIKNEIARCIAFVMDWAQHGLKSVAKRPTPDLLD